MMPGRSTPTGGSGSSIKDFEVRMKAILFDLDGSLLPMDQDGFVGYYFKLVGEMMAGLGYDPKVSVKAVIAGTKAMSENDGSVTNEEAFWKVFQGLLGEGVKACEPDFDRFYRTEFEKTRAFASPTPMAKQIVLEVRAKGYRTALATNPIFPRVATMARLRWAGLSEDDFELISTYEDFRFSKPNPGYYGQVLDIMALIPEDCLMAGNDIGDDAVALDFGMDFFLITDCLINRGEKDISPFRKGSLQDFLYFVKNLPVVG